MVHDIAGVAAVQVKLLRGAGHEVDQVALPAFGASWRWPVKAFALPFRFAAYMPAVMRLRRGRYDILHIHFLSQGVVGVLSGRPFVAQAHGSDLHLNLTRSVYRPVTRTVLDKARAVFYVTPNLPAFLKGYEKKLVYLPNPLDVPQSARSAAAPAQVRTVVIFTRLHPVKGVDRIFPAVERLRELVEVTAIESGPLAAEYLARYGRWVKFIQPVPHSNIWEVLAAFDVVIGQMRQGVLGLMEIEAMAAGRPVIAAVDSALYPDDPPPVVAASGPDEIVAAVLKLRDDPGELARLARLGREWVERNHGFAHHLELLESTYKTAIASP